MKAAYLTGHGGLEVLAYGDLPVPEPGPGEARVAVRAVALNHLDVFVRRGWKGLKLAFPHVVGSDAAGVVDAVGPGVEGLAVGDAVVLAAGWSCGRCRACLAGNEHLCRQYHLFGEHRGGAGAGRFVAPARNLLPKPDGLSFVDAAAVGVAYLTAWHMLVTRAQVRLGETVLVHGASAGVSVAGIRIARRLGARVIATTSSPQKAARAQELGADAVIDYTREDLKARLKALAPEGVEVVFEHPGAATFDLSVKALAQGGRVVTCGATTGPEVALDLRRLFMKQASLLGSTMGTRAELMAVLDEVAAGNLRVVVDRVLPLSEIHEGHRALESGAHFGKIVLEPPA